MDEVAKAQKLVIDAPIAFVAGLFAILFFGMVSLFVRAKDRHLRELASIYKEHAERIIKIEVVLHGLLEFTPYLKILALEAKKKQGRRGEVSPDAPTKEFKLEIKP